MIINEFHSTITQFSSYYAQHMCYKLLLSSFIKLNYCDKIAIYIVCVNREIFFVIKFNQ